MTNIEKIKQVLKEINDAREKATPGEWSCYDANEGEIFPLWSVATDNYFNPTDEDEPCLNLNIYVGCKSDAEIIALAANKITSLTKALDVAVEKFKEIYADGSYEDIASEISVEAINQVATILQLTDTK